MRRLDASLCQACRDAADRFLGCWLVGVVADRRHHGERQRHQGHMTVPAVPGTALVVIEAELGLGGLEAVLDRPAPALGLDQRLDGRTDRAPCQGERMRASWKPAWNSNPAMG